MKRDRVLVLFLGALLLAPPVAMADVVVSEKITSGGIADPGDGFGETFAVDEGRVIIGFPRHDLPGENEAGGVAIFEESATGGGYTLDETVLPVAPQAIAQHGFAVGIDGSAGWAAVGVPLHDTPSGGSGAGMVAIHERTAPGTWIMRLEMTPLLERPFARFGSALSMEDDRLVVGAPGYTTNQGGINMFRRIAPPCVTCWASEGALIQHPAPQTGDEFGSAVDLSCGRFIASAPNRGSAFAGAAYVYTYDLLGTGTWDLDQELASPNPLPGVKFGGDKQGGVAVTCDYVAVAQAVTEEVWVYRTADYAVEAALTGPEPRGRYGASIDISGPRLVIGDPFRAAGNGSEGVVYYYERSGIGDWELLATLTAPDGSGSVAFGSFVQIGDGNTLFIGAPGEDAVYFVNLDDLLTPVPATGPAGLVILCVLLAAVGSGVMMRRRSRLIP